MPDAFRRVQVFLASPSDVEEERSLVQREVDRVNRTVGNPLNMHADLIRWETHGRPGFGADAQDVLNRQIEPKDIFLGVMWTRFGTSTSRAESGTEEEFERAYESWKQNRRPTILLYFKTTPFFPESVEQVKQLEKVLTFKKRVQDRGALYWEFGDSAEFAALVHDHLAEELRALASQSASSPNATPAAITAFESETVLSYDGPGAVAIRPTLIIVYRRDGWYLQNTGRGAALDILVAQLHVKGPSKGQWFNPVRVPTLAAGEEAKLTWLGHVNDTGLGATYKDEDGRPFSSVTGNDKTTVTRSHVFPEFSEEQIKRDWHFFSQDGW